MGRVQRARPGRERADGVSVLSTGTGIVGHFDGLAAGACSGALADVLRIRSRLTAFAGRNASAKPRVGRRECRTVDAGRWVDGVRGRCGYTGDLATAGRLGRHGRARPDSGSGSGEGPVECGDRGTAWLARQAVRFERRGSGSGLRSCRVSCSSTARQPLACNNGQRSANRGTENIDGAVMEACSRG